ncbi:MAG: hypothetical protein O7B99_11580 [Planctomycetota bacterium]|nr:hypothetical protein [Planctomycetota bacterium]
MLATVRTGLVALCIGFVAPVPVHGQDLAVGDVVRLVQRDLGIPAHPDVGDNRISRRIPAGAIVTIGAFGAPPRENWVRIDFDGVEDWIVSKYVDAIVGTGAVPQHVVVGCWNLEHFNGSSRGFPETPGAFGRRNATQIQAIADTITNDLGASLLVLEEIRGEMRFDPDLGEDVPVSDHLQELVDAMSGTWAYVLGRSGNTQRVAFLYDTSVVRVNEVVEWDVPARIIEGADIFARNPIAAHVTLLQGAQARNDLIVVGLHLASGQSRDDNHDAAIEELLRRLDQARAAGQLGGAAEQDVLLMGDLNANMFSPPAEQFFVDFETPGSAWDVLADDVYPATRLSGNPLGLANSRIDYIIASTAGGGRTGLVGDEILADSANVHTELLTARPPDRFRADLSDHLPVTVEIALVPDND